MEQKNRTNFEISGNKNNCNPSVKFTTETETLVRVTSNNNEPEVKEDIDYILLCPFLCRLQHGDALPP